MHLTNYSINKKNVLANDPESKNKFEINDGEGYKWSISALKKVMAQFNIDEKQIWRQIEDIVIKTIISGEV